MSCDYIDLAAPGVRALQPYQPGKPESELAREYGLDERDIVKLASNENPLGPPDSALEAVRKCLGGSGAGVARYPDGGGYALRRRLAGLHDVDPATITLGNGSNDVLELLARAFLTPRDEAVFSAHAFAVYYLTTQAVGAVQCIAPAYPAGHAMPYGHDLDAFAERVNERTRLIFIANPNNPTGTWIAAERLRAFIAGLPEQVLVVVDEAYVDYADAPDYASVTPLLAGHPNLVVTRTFSKAYGLAGLRIGYALSSAPVADLLNRVRQPFNVSLPAQAAALAALDDDLYLARSRAANLAGLAQLRRGFDELGLDWLPTQGNFLCVRLPRPGVEVFQALLPRGVIVRPVANYGLPGFVRVSVGLEQENRRLLSALQEVLRSDG